MNNQRSQEPRRKVMPKKGTRHLRGKKTIGASIIISFLLIGIVSAGLIDYFGKITATVEVEGPVFYLDLDESGNDNYLSLNEILSEKQKNWENEIIFESDSLGITSLYDADFNVHLWMKPDNKNNSIKIEIRNTEDNSLICESQEKVFTGTSGHYHKEFICSSNGEINLDKNDGFKLVIKEMTGQNCGFSIRSGHEYTQGGNPAYDRIEISAT